jgi:hypothetical protein
VKLEPIVQMPNLVSGMWRRFVVHAFEGKVTVDDMTRMEVAGTAWLKKNPGQLEIGRAHV